MRMMVDTAKAANGVQFLLITPQDMGVSAESLFCCTVESSADVEGRLQSVNFGPEVRISKLDDPNRSEYFLTSALNQA